MTMTMTATGPSRFDWGVGSAIGTAFGTLFRNVVPFLCLSLLVGIPGMVLGALGVSRWLRILIELVMGQIITIALIYGTVQSLRSRKVGIGECLTQGFRRLPAAIVVAILAVIAYILGFILLIIPGLMLITMWAVAIPAAAVEKAGVGASFSRSASLTRGRRWRVFGVLAVSWILYLVVYLVVTLAITAPLFGAFGVKSLWVIPVVMWLVAGVLAAYLSTLSGVLYYFLRRDKEGVDIESIASVFD